MLALVGLADDAQAVPADLTGDESFEVSTARRRGLEAGRDSVDVGRVARTEIRRTTREDKIVQLLDQEASTVNPLCLQHAPGSIDPFFGLRWITSTA